MRDDDRRPVAHQRLQRRLYRALGLGIERRCRFVEYQDRRVFEHCTRDRDPLPLPARELDAGFSDDGVETLWHRANEIERMRRVGRTLDRIARRTAHRAVGDIGGDRVVEEHDVLADHRDVRSQVGQRERVDVMAVDADASR